MAGRYNAGAPLREMDPSDTAGVCDKLLIFQPDINQVLTATSTINQERIHKMNPNWAYCLQADRIHTIPHSMEINRICQFKDPSRQHTV